MRLAFIHYHLRGGGVTRVIRQAVEALKRNGGEYLVFSGEEPVNDDDLAADRVCVVPELAYGEKMRRDGVPQLVEQMAAKCRQLLGGQPDVWHFHNHALGKNMTMPLLVDYMAENNYPLLLQLHDFAEDNRPANFEFLRRHLQLGDSAPESSESESEDSSSVSLYPQKGRVHYAVLNNRDQRFLLHAGARDDRLTVLPNAIWFDDSDQLSDGSSDSTKDKPCSRPLYLYPGRAIRRKNIGEFLLWSAVAEGDELFAITLEPRNPEQRRFYDKWVEFSQSHSLPVAFNYGHTSELSFPRLVQSAEGVITTSVREGFGLAFLEPWILGTPVYGRNLPAITEDFKQNGVDLSSLYTRLLLPREWLDADYLYRRIQQAAETFWQSYGREMPADFPDRVMADASDGEMIDFARLDEELQEDLLRQLVRSEEKRSFIKPRQFRDYGDDKSRLLHNAEVIRNQYSLISFSERLSTLYNRIADSEPITPQHATGDLSADKLLDCFMSPEQFSLLAL